MDLSAIIVTAFGILFFFGGAAWLEIHSRKSKRPARHGEQRQQPAVTQTSAGRGESRLAARSE